MNKHIALIITITTAMLLASCDHGRKEAASQHIVPLYRMISDYPALDSAGRADLMARDSTIIKAFMSTVSELPVDDELLNLWSASLPVSVFTPPVDSVYPTLTNIEADLGAILANAAAEGLSLPHREYVAVVYGRREAILFVDSMMMIALNHYLGADYDGYSHWPAYMRVYKEPSVLPYDMAEALVATTYRYRTEGADATLLSRMLYEGALAKAKLSIVPDATLEGVLGYDSRTLKWLDDHQKEIWQQIVSRRLLYDTSETTIDKLIAPSPMVTMLAQPTPGRAGRYIGFKIVEAYCRRNKATLPYLLSPEFYDSQQTLAQSGF